MAGTEHLRKYNQTFYKDKTVSDAAQIPAATASVKVYKQGATVASGTSVTTAGGGVAVSVRSVGHLVLSDTVQLGTDVTKQMIVEEITNDTAIKLRSTTGSSITVADGDRLVIYSSLPTLYSESTGRSSTANPATTDATGYVGFYTPETRFDVIVSGTGITSKLYTDNESGWARGGVHWVNVKDYSTFQAALDALPTTTSKADGGTFALGGVLYVPAGRYSHATTPAFNGLVITQGTTSVIGDGSPSTYIHYFAGGSENVHMIDIKSAGGTVIRGLYLDGPASAGTGAGINIYKAGSHSVGVDIIDVTIINSASWGVSSQPDAGFYTSKVRMDNCTISGAASGGSMVMGKTGDGGTNNLFFNRCEFDGPGFGTFGTGPMNRGCVHLEHVGVVRFTDCSFQGPGTSPAISTLGISIGVFLSNCYMELNNAAGTAAHAIEVSGALTGLSISNLYLGRLSTGNAPRILKTATDGTLVNCSIVNAVIIHKESSYQTDDVVLNHASDTISFVNVERVHQDTGIIKELSITDRAGVALVNAPLNFAQLKLPGVASQATITRPTEGTIIYDTTANKLKLYNGTAWETITSA
jgi:hypothetical protein